MGCLGMLDKGTVKEIAQDYAKKVANAFDPDAIFLFGSYVNGEPHIYSDIDIGVVIEDFGGDWLDVSVELLKMSRDYGKGTYQTIEPHLLDPAVCSSGFANHIMKTGEIIYQKEISACKV
jgi:predicted nucleotidyltransferase